MVKCMFFCYNGAAWETKDTLGMLGRKENSMHDKTSNDCRDIDVSINLNVIINLGGAFGNLIDVVKKLLKR